MAKFCGNCGSQMDDNAAVCGYCGAPLDSAAGITPGGGFKIDDPENKAKIKKYAIMGGAAVAAIIIIVFALKIIGANTGYKGTINNYLKAYETQDAADMVKSIHSYVLEEDYNDDEEEMTKALQVKLDKDIRQIESKFEDGKYNITCKFGKDTDLGNTAKKDLFGEEDADSFDTVKKVKATIIAKKGSKKKSLKKTFYLAKDNGKWKIIGAEDES